MHVFNLLTRRVSAVPKSTRVWYYQHEGEDRQLIVKDGKYWYYNPPANLTQGLTGEVGCDTLNGAKGDLLTYEGTRVWSELISNQ